MNSRTDFLFVVGREVPWQFLTHSMLQATYLTSNGGNMRFSIQLFYCYSSLEWSRLECSRLTVCREVFVTRRHQSAEKINGCVLCPDIIFCHNRVSMMLVASGKMGTLFFIAPALTRCVLLSLTQTLTMRRYVDCRFRRGETTFLICCH